MTKNLPAVILSVSVFPFNMNPEDGDACFHSSVVIFEKRNICDCCGGLVSDLVAIWDFDFDRSCDFFIPFGSYCTGRELVEGVEAYKELTISGRLIQ